jgi:hypothetical protein
VGKWKTNSKLLAINPNMLVTMLNVNRPNVTKSARLDEKILLHAAYKNIP